MPALLAAKVIAAAQHFINHIPVADSGAMTLPPADLMAATKPALLITVVTRVFLASVFCASMSSARWP